MTAKLGNWTDWQEPEEQRDLDVLDKTIVRVLVAVKVALNEMVLADDARRFQVFQLSISQLLQEAFAEATGAEREKSDA